MTTKNSVLEIAGQTIQPGERRSLHIDLGKLYNHTNLDLDLEVIHGRRAGPTLMVCAAIHGDELNGV
ncbi:MAG: putative deacylase, partial [Motiliproteus sp.]